MSHQKKKQAAVAALRRGALWREAAQAARRRPRTLFRWVAADPAFAAAIQAARAAAALAVEAVAFANCLDPDPAHDGLRMFWLKAHKPEVYRDRPARGRAGGLAIRHVYAEPAPGSSVTPQPAQTPRGRAAT